MATMQAAFFDGQGEMEVREVDRPEVGPGDALIRVQAVGICGSDLQMNVDKTEPDRLPAGHEVAGEVVAIGEGSGPDHAGQACRCGYHRAWARVFNVLVLPPGAVQGVPGHGAI